EYLAGHLDDDRVGITIRHQPGEGAAARHAIAAGVVNNDQIDTARFLALGGETSAGTPADNRFSPRGHTAKLFQYRGSFNPCHWSPLHSASSRPTTEQRAECIDNGRSDLGVVNVLPDADELAVGGLPHRPLQCAKQRLIRFSVPEGLTLRVECRDAAFRQ